jgi:hypothetical protein
VWAGVEGRSATHLLRRRLAPLLRLLSLVVLCPLRMLRAAPCVHGALGAQGEQGVAALAAPQLGCRSEGSRVAGGLIA